MRSKIVVMAIEDEPFLIEEDQMLWLWLQLLANLVDTG